MLSAFKRTLHVGIKAEKALSGFRAVKAQSTSSSPGTINESAFRESFTNLRADVLVKNLKALQNSFDDIAAESFAPKTDIQEIEKLANEYEGELRKKQEELLSSMRSGFAKYEEDAKRKYRGLIDKIDIKSCIIVVNGRK